MSNEYSSAAGVGKCFSSGLIAAHTVAAVSSLPTRFMRRDQAVHAAGSGGSSPSSYTPQAGDCVGGAGHRGNGGSAHLWTTYGPKNSCRCSEHCLELSCDHGRMRFVKCYVCGSDWLMPAVRPNPMTAVKTAKMPTKWENGKRGRIPEGSITVLL